MDKSKWRPELKTDIFLNDIYPLTAGQIQNNFKDIEISSYLS